MALDVVRALSMVWPMRHLNDRFFCGILINRLATNCIIIINVKLSRSMHT